MTIHASNCNAISTMLDAFHDGELTGEERSAVDEHLSSCDSCRQALSEIRVVAQSLKSLPAVTLRRDFAADVDKLMGTAKPKVVPFGKWAVAGAASVAAAVAVFALAIRVHSPLPSNELAARPTSAPNQVVSQVHPQTATAQENKIASKDSPHQLNQHPDKAGSASGSGIEKIAQLPTATQVKTLEKSRNEGRERSTKEGVTQEANKVALAKPATQLPAQKNVTPALAQQGSGSAVQQLADRQTSKNPELVAVYDPEQSNSVTEELGITTDEDGLYAIKL